ncbi:MAG: response regulator transcription factor [Acidobacteriota bacterium]
MRVLVVEDEMEIRSAVARRLRHLGHGVDEAADCGDAESFLATYRYDVVVLDRMLPDGDSIELLGRWRAKGLAAPVLFLTARDQVADRVGGFEAGADDYLVKPFAMEELVARLVALARRSPALRQSTVTVGDLEIDASRRQVKRGGVVLTLRPKEFAILELLAGRAGRVVSRQDIVASCWGEDHEPTSNVEEVVVAALRRKLGKPALIKTVRGAGYLLEAPE